MENFKTKSRSRKNTLHPSRRKFERLVFAFNHAALTGESNALGEAQPVISPSVAKFTLLTKIANDQRGAKQESRGGRGASRPRENSARNDRSQAGARANEVRAPCRTRDFFLSFFIFTLVAHWKFVRVRVECHVNAGRSKAAGTSSSMVWAGGGRRARERHCSSSLEGARALIIFAANEIRALRAPEKIMPARAGREPGAREGK